MAKQRRTGSETSETRQVLLDVTERLMVEEGYAAVSSRSVAKAADVTPALVHYYFGTLDDLFIAVLRRRAVQQLDRQRRMLETSDRPLHALWEAIREPARTGLILEFVSLANHRKSIQGELAAISEQFRTLQAELVAAHLERTGRDLGGLSALAVVTIINSIATTTVLERSIGIGLGHAEQAQVVEQWLDRLEGGTTTARRSTSPTRRAGPAGRAGERPPRR